MKRYFCQPAIGTVMGGKSGAAPLTIQNKMLFWGSYSEISGGRMPNKIRDSVDYLTVSGVARSETYQAPHNATYESADTDYIWFKSDSSQRTVTTAELIAYDFERTLVYYDDNAPYYITEIIILKAGQNLTEAESSLIRDYCHLSLWWDGALSEHGNLKGNRGPAKSTWEPEAVYCDEAIAFFERMTAVGETPTDERKTVIDTCIKSLKSNNLWDTQWDVFVVLKGYGQQSTLLNWIKNSHNATAVSSPTYTEDVGWNKTGTGCYINSNFKPSTQGILYKKDDASFVIKGTGMVNAATGHGTIGSACTVINGNNSRYCNSLTSIPATLYNGDGYKAVSRDNSSTFNNYFNAGAETLNRVSQALPDYNAYIMAVNNWGALTQQVDNGETDHFYAFGKALSQAQFDTLRTIMDTYFSSL